jgi:archaellum component FlaC
MILFDLIMKAPDSYWKRRFHEEEIKRRRAEADARYFQDTGDDLREKLGIVSERDCKQASAISEYNKEIQRLKDDVETLIKDLESKQREIDTLREALRAEREARRVLSISNRLWEQLKAEAKEAAT